MAKIRIIDDDLSMDLLADALRFRGHDVCRLKGASEALSQLDELVCAELILLDVIMPFSTSRKGDMARNDAGGMEVYRRLRARRPDLPVIAFSAIQDISIIDVFNDDNYAQFLSKWDGPRLRELIHYIEEMLGIPRQPMKPAVFIVHGQNEAVKYSLKNYLQNTLKMDEPTILHEKPNGGRTIIEKFEDYAGPSALVFILLTPDDRVATGQETDEMKRRARQNVIFEMGYFMGTLGRKSGRVVLLYMPPLELPSDLSGVVYIDISQGIESAGEAIRREITYVTK